MRHRYLYVKLYLKQYLLYNNAKKIHSFRKQLQHINTEKAPGGKGGYVRWDVGTDEEAAGLKGQVLWMKFMKFSQRLWQDYAKEGRP